MGITRLSRCSAVYILYRVDPRSEAAKRPFRHTVIIRPTDFALAGSETAPPIQDVFRAVASDETRNDLIFDDILRALESRRSPVVITERTDHLEKLEARLRRFAKNVVVLRGGQTDRQRRDILTKLANVRNDEERVILATGRYLGEGFDDPRLDTLFLTMPIAWKGTLAQYAGRLHRRHEPKREVLIYDYVDRNVPVLVRMAAKRKKAYLSIGYELSELDDLLGRDLVGSENGAQSLRTESLAHLPNVLAETDFELPETGRVNRTEGHKSLRKRPKFQAPPPKPADNGRKCAQQQHQQNQGLVGGEAGLEPTKA